MKKAEIIFLKFHQKFPKFSEKQNQWKIFTRVNKEAFKKCEIRFSKTNYLNYESK